MATVLKNYDTFSSNDQSEEEKTEADQKCSELQINKSMILNAISQQPSMIVDHQPNSFYNYTISSITKNQIKPELYQLAFDVQNDLDEHDQQQLQLEQQLSEKLEQSSKIREVKPIKPKQISTVVTSDPKNGQSKVVLSSNSIFKACSQPIVSKHFNAATLIMKNTGNNVSPICCCSVM